VFLLLDNFDILWMRPGRGSLALTPDRRRVAELLRWSRQTEPGAIKPVARLELEEPHGRQSRRLKAARKAFRRTTANRSRNESKGARQTGAVRAAGPAAGATSHRHGIVLEFLMIGAGVVLFLDNSGLFHFTTLAIMAGG